VGVVDVDERGVVVEKEIEREKQMEIGYVCM